MIYLDKDKELVVFIVNNFMYSIAYEGRAVFEIVIQIWKGKVKE